MNALQEKWNEPEPVKLTVGDFLLLDDAGAFIERGKIELIEGVIVEMNAQHVPHARAKGIMFRRLAEAVEALGPDYEALVEAGVSIPPHNLPEPDVLIMGAPVQAGMVPVATVLLAVEVADTTLRVDLGTKARIYARASVPEYWVVDLKGRKIHQFWAPRAEEFAERRTVALGQPITAATIDGLSIETGGF